MKHKLRIFLKNNNQSVVLCVTIIFLIAGLIQYAFGLTYILLLTPLVIGIITGLTILYWDIEPARKLILTLGAIITGMIVEIIGVNTNILFGDYTYGSVLGLKIAGVPLLIGVTWALVTISAWNIVSYSSFGAVANIVLAACIIVIFDLILEQFATAFSLWQWQNGIIPLKNYISWYVVSLFIVGVYAKWGKHEHPSIYAAAILPTMAVFFWIMLLIRG